MSIVESKTLPIPETITNVINQPSRPFLEKLWRAGENVSASGSLLSLGLGWSLVSLSFFGRVDMVLPQLTIAGITSLGVAGFFGASYLAARLTRSAVSNYLGFLKDHHKKTNYL